MLPTLWILQLVEKVVGRRRLDEEDWMKATGWKRQDEEDWMKAAGWKRQDEEDRMRRGGDKRIPWEVKKIICFSASWEGEREESEGMTYPFISY